MLHALLFKLQEISRLCSSFSTMVIHAQYPFIPGLQYFPFNKHLTAKKFFFSCSVQNISSYTIQKRECYGRSNSSRGLIAQVSKGQLGSRMILDMIMMMTPNLHIKTYPGPTKHTLLVIWRPEHMLKFTQF